MATRNRKVLIPSRSPWKMARSLLFSIHTQRRSRRPSPYVNDPFFLIRTFVLIPPQALIVASCISLVATVGLLAAIAVRPNSIPYLPRTNVLQKKKMSAFNTRTIKNPNMFVRTHVAFYFVSLLLSDILQCESQFICILLLYVSCARVYYRCSGEDNFEPTDIRLGCRL
jgi:hypothetical protein